jgi:glycosyltransferase involved in cell wall biosynthesis
MYYNTPFFSVIVPVYNRESFIVSCINSILDQDFDNYEIICVDDGSTDNSISFLNAFQDKRIRIIQHDKNFGRCIARNTGIKEAKGKWLCFLDSDDTYYPNHLSSHKKLIDLYPSQNAFATEQLWDNKPKKYATRKLFEELVDVTLEDCIHSNPISLNQLSYNSEKISLLFPDERIPISEDWLFMRELLLKTSILKQNVTTTNVNEHDMRSMNATSALEIAKWNEYTALLFLNRNNITGSLNQKILGNTYLLCANILLSFGDNTNGIRYLKTALKIPRIYKNYLLYNGLLKICLNLLKQSFFKNNNA